MSQRGSSVPKLVRVRPQSRTAEREDSDREDLRVQLLLGSVAFGSIALSVISYVHPFG